jgi:peptide/nickel transport system substrate-binding protein
VLAACGSRPKSLVIAVPSGPAMVRPNGLNEEFTLSVLSNVYETLVDLDSGLALRPGLAESWHSPDDLTWVFQIRQGVKLHDGRELTAGLVAQSLEDARVHPESRRRVQLAVVQSIEAPDARTLVLKTRRPFDPLPARLSNVAIWAPGQGDAAHVGTGPFELVRWSPDGDALLSAFEGYRQGPSQVTEVTFRVLPKPEDRVAALRDGRAQLAVDVPADSLEALRQGRGTSVVVQNGLRVLFLAMDAREQFRDPRLRRAVSLAVDRQALVQGALGGYAEVVEEIVSPQELGGQQEELPERRHDPAEARRLVAEAGFPSGFDVALEYMPQKYRAMEAVARSIAADLLQAGIRVSLVPRTPGEMLARVERQQTSMYVLGWISDNGDGRMSYEYLLHSPVGGFGLDNGGGYSNPAADELIERSLSRLDDVDRRGVLSSLARLIYDDVPVLPLYRQADLYATDARLTWKPRLDRRVRAWDMAWRD